jgi:cytochrome c5
MEEAGMIKPLLLVSTVTLFVFAASSAAGRLAQDTAQAPASEVVGKSFAKPGPEMLSKAKKLYDADCALCHNENGDGKSDAAKQMSLNLADWTNPKSLAGKSDQELFKIIRDGKGNMPSEAEGRAHDAELRAIVYYCRSLTSAQPAAAPAPTEATPAPAPANATPAPAPVPPAN